LSFFYVLMIKSLPWLNSKKTFHRLGLIIKSKINYLL